MDFQAEQLLLYAVTDRAWTGQQTLYQQLEQALQGGVTLVQLREKQLDEQAFIKEAKEIKELCHRYGVPLIINDNVKVALESGADGVHVGQSDCPIREIRSLAGADFIIGATAKTLAQARQAQADGADYLGVGAVFPSPTKPGAIRITQEQLREICGAVTIPVVAIGGIGAENIRELAGCGMQGVAVVSAIFAAEDIEGTTKELKKQAERICTYAAGELSGQADTMRAKGAGK